MYLQPDPSLTYLQLQNISRAFLEKPVYGMYSKLLKQKPDTIQERPSSICKILLSRTADRFFLESTKVLMLESASCCASYALRWQSFKIVV
jgi:hypothetical protein